MRNAARLAALGLAVLLAANQGAASPGGGPQVQWVYGYGGAETEEHPHAAIQVSAGGYEPIHGQSCFFRSCGA